MGLKALSKIQLGQEGAGTPGTPVAADTIWRGPFAGLKDARNTEPIEEDLGVAMKSSRKFASQLLAEFSFPTCPLTPEQCVHVFEAGIKQVNTGVGDGVGSSGYVYSYPFGLASVNDISTYTIETGDDVEAEEAEYMFCTAFTISGVKGQPIEISSDWMGRQVSSSSFTGGLSVPTVSEIAAINSTLYIDDPGGSMGNTAISAGNIMEFTLSVTTGRTALFTADSGNLYFVEEYFDIDAVEATLELKWLHKAAVLAEKTAWRANTNRLVQIDCLGDAYGTAGTGTDLNGYKGLRIQFPGSYNEFSAVEHDAGQSIVTATLTGGYETVSGEVLTIKVYNELAAVP